MTEVNRLKRLVEDMTDVRLAVLFGSTATRSLRRDSDIDIGLSLEKGALLTPALSAALGRVVLTRSRRRPDGRVRSPAQYFVRATSSS